MYKGNQIPNNLETCYGNLIDSTNLIRIIKSTKPDEIYNLDDKRDWSCVQDYAESMWLMLQEKKLMIM